MPCLQSPVRPPIPAAAAAGHTSPVNVMGGGGNNLDPGGMYADVEHYDIDNASSIAPSDIDIVYHYKGYRADGSGGHQRFPKKRKNIHMNTPLAR